MSMKRRENDYRIVFLIGLIGIAIVGTIWHFVYDWINENQIAGYFFPISESVFEHTKILFYPFLLFGIYARYQLREKYSGITHASLEGSLIAPIVMTILFYTYQGVFGGGRMWVDILIFYVSVAVGIGVMYRRMEKEPRENANMSTVVLVILNLLVFLTYLFFTYRNSGTGIFMVP